MLDQDLEADGKPCCDILWLWEGNLFVLYLLSDDIGIVAGLNFECTVVGP